MTPVIEVEQLTKRYGDRTAVDDISFGVARGEIVGFLGPNGAGKSTTLRMVTGFLAPTAGRVRVGGDDVQERPRETQRRIGYMPEGVPLYPELRVREYLRHRAALKAVPWRDRGRRVDAAVDLAGLGEARDRLIGQLSKGFRQRVGLADALVADPSVLILDEPTSGLDPNQIREVRDLVRSFAGEKTVILSTHILPEVEATCGRVVIIHRGRVVEEGDPASLRGRAAGRDVVELAGRGEPSAYQGVLAALPGVAAVRQVPLRPEDGSVPGALRFEVEGEQGPGEGAAAPGPLGAPGGDLVERVAQAVAGAGLVLRGLGARRVSLEDVFARLTLEAGDDDPAVAAGQDDQAPDPAEQEAQNS
jgi:ABC-2 type transport system ATP-binding protein